MKPINFFETYTKSVKETQTVQKIEKVMYFNKPEDFKQIRMLPFNREAGFRQDLANSMNQYGFIGSIDLIYTDLFSEGAEKGMFFLYVPEGQHRIFTALQLGIPIIGLVHEYEFKNIPDVVRFVSVLNSTHKAWIAMNYINAYVSLEMKNYQTLLKITKSSAFTVTTVALMLYGFRSKNVVTSAIKNGDFVCNYLNETLYTIKISNVLNKAIKQIDRRAKVMTNRMVLGLHSVTMKQNFDLNKFTDMYVKKYSNIKEMKLDDYTDVFTSWL